jgi:RNA polymerase primary sigma factor
MEEHVSALAHDLPQFAKNDSTDSITRYLREISQVPLLTAEQERILGQRIAAGDEEALLHMVEANLRLVVNVAKCYRSEQLSLLDLIQEGNLGLMHAAGKFDYSRGIRFATYASWWIRQAVTRAAMNQGRTIHVPVHVIEELARRRRTTHQGSQDGEQGPVPMRDELGERRLAHASQLQQPCSLDRPIGDDDLSLAETLQDEHAVAPADEAEYSLLQDHLCVLLGRLPERERRIVELRYGLLDGNARTLQEVSAIIGVTAARIRQLEIAALQRIRQSPDVDQLRVYLA